MQLTKSFWAADIRLGHVQSLVHPGQKSKFIVLFILVYILLCYILNRCSDI